LDDAAELLQLGDAVSGIRVESDDIFAAPTTVRRALNNTEAGTVAREALTVRDWTQENASYFRAIKLEKTMMALLLSLIIGVAAFNIVAMLVMVVTEKRGGIAILRTLGCSRREVVMVFLLQGTVIGWLGAVLGIGLGIWMSLNIDTLAPLLETVFGFQFMPADLYYLTALPSDLQTNDVVFASVGVLLVTAMATVYPALRAAQVQPAEVLRYE
jgi:lipoprotein-releasing system permease protein